MDAISTTLVQLEGKRTYLYRGQITKLCHDMFHALDLHCEWFEAVATYRQHNSHNLAISWWSEWDETFAQTEKLDLMAVCLQVEAVVEQIDVTEDAEIPAALASPAVNNIPVWQPTATSKCEEYTVEDDASDHETRSSPPTSPGHRATPPATSETHRRASTIPRVVAQMRSGIAAPRASLSVLSIRQQQAPIWLDRHASSASPQDTQPATTISKSASCSVHTAFPMSPLSGGSTIPKTSRNLHTSRGSTRIPAFNPNGHVRITPDSGTNRHKRTNSQFPTPLSRPMDSPTTQSTLPVVPLYQSPSMVRNNGPPIHKTTMLPLRTNTTVTACRSTTISDSDRNSRSWK